MNSILFVCTQNSSRTIMAEAIFNHLATASFRAQSAGSHFAGFVHPEALKTLKRHNINCEQLHSKSWNQFSLQKFDCIVSMCGHMENQSWPLFPGRPKKLYWNIADPTQTKGTPAEIEAAYEKCFLSIEERVLDLLQLLESGVLSECEYVRKDYAPLSCSSS
jgi:arsenate reductase (thioredoxin)